jgi:hypothetical protein
LTCHSSRLHVNSLTELHRSELRAHSSGGREERVRELMTARAES